MTLQLPLERIVVQEETYTPELIASVTELSHLLLSEEDLASTLDRIVGLVCDSVPGCDSAGLTLIDASGPRTAAATDDFTLRIDYDQYDTGQGPCLHAATTNETVSVEDTRSDSRWPVFSEQAVSHGLRSSLSIPLPAKSPLSGALNMYSKTANAFGERSEVVATLFAAQGAVALTNAHTYAAALSLTKQLEEAVRTREVIGEAMGILIEREGVTKDRAFEMLKTASQNANVKLRVIAERIVDQAVQ